MSNFNNDVKKVKFTKEALENESQSTIQTLKRNLNNNKNINEEEKDEILLKKKRNFNNNPRSNENILDFSDFKNPERIYSYSSNKYSSSSIKKIEDYIIKETPKKPQNYELEESRYKSSNYKFSSGEKIITTIENPSGIKAFDNSVCEIENYYLEKKLITEIGIWPDCNFFIIS